jgi:hypothetical protein
MVCSGSYYSIFFKYLGSGKDSILYKTKISRAQFVVAHAGSICTVDPIITSINLFIYGEKERTS